MKDTTKMKKDELSKRYFEVTNKYNNMEVEVVNVDGLDNETIGKIENPMKFNQWWLENETTFVELENSKGDIIRIFPERIKATI